MEGHVFIMSRKTLLHDSLTRYLTSMHNLSTVFVDKDSSPFASFARAASSAPAPGFFECERRIFLKFFALPNP